MIDLRNADYAEVLGKIEKVDLVVTDPPYDIAIAEASPATSYGNFGYKDDFLDRLNSVTLTKFDQDKFCALIWDAMKEPNIYIFCNKKQVMGYLNFFVNGKGCLYEILCWHKLNTPPHIL